MVDPQSAGVSDDVWQEATASCHELRVARTIQETHDSISIVFEIPESLREKFRYQAGQFLSFKIPFEGHVLVRSYSLASSPDTDAEPKVTVKRVDDGRISNWMNDRVKAGSKLMVVPPAGLFVLGDTQRDLLLFSGGSGITPCISIIKTALATTDRKVALVYANRDARSIIFEAELEALLRDHPDRLEVIHSLDDRDGYLSEAVAQRHLGSHLDRDIYLCGPGAFMATVEAGLIDAGVHVSQLHIERFVSPPDPGTKPEAETARDATEGKAPSHVTVVLDGTEHQVPYEPGERVLTAARRAGLDPPFSCEEGYCSCCMAKLVEGDVSMETNDCLTPDLLDEGWVLTCQASCKGGKVRVEYPD
jgi:3-ketosteroid 9alpha-monooxygenase subunit B